MSGKKTHTDKLKKHTAQDEDNLALEIAEDARLRDLGIDPDGDSIDIMVALDELSKKLKTPPTPATNKFNEDEHDE